MKISHPQLHPLFSFSSFLLHFVLGFCLRHLFQYVANASAMAIHLISSGVAYDSNIYLLTGTRNILIDAGTGYGHKSVLEKIDGILNGGTVDMIILTHCHFDHSGGAHSLCTHYNCPCLAYENDAHHILDSDEVVLYDLFGSDYMPVDPDELFDGDIIDIGDHKLNVVWTPGHTDGSMCLYDEVTKSLFSGDTVFSEGVGRTDFPTGSIVELRSSVERISSIDIIGIYPGHGDPRYDDGRRSIDMAMRIVGV